MSDAVTVAVVASVSSLALAIVNAIIAWLQRKAEKKNATQQRIDDIDKQVDVIDKKLDKLTTHNEMQYMALLRLTVMDTDMPTSERLIAGQEYLDRNGNGDVRKFFEHFKAEVDAK